MVKQIGRMPKTSVGVAIGAGILAIGVLLSSCAGEASESVASQEDAVSEKATDQVASQEDAVSEKATDQVGSDAALVSASGFDGKWPFGTDEARIECLPEDALGVSLNGEIFALNGTAISAGYEELTVETSDAIWLDNPATDFKVSLGDFSKVARNFCGF